MRLIGAHVRLWTYENIIGQVIGWFAKSTHSSSLMTRSAGEGRREEGWEGRECTHSNVICPLGWLLTAFSCIPELFFPRRDYFTIIARLAHGCHVTCMTWRLDTLFTWHVIYHVFFLFFSFHALKGNEIFPRNVLMCFSPSDQRQLVHISWSNDKVEK